LLSIGSSAVDLKQGNMSKRFSRILISSKVTIAKNIVIWRIKSIRIAKLAALNFLKIDYYQDRNFVMQES